LDAFNDEIEQWIIDIFKGLGYDTAKSVLDAPVDELVKATDLEKETIDEIIEILSAEFKK
jgi:N utilization substance protein A